MGWLREMAVSLQHGARWAVRRGELALVHLAGVLAGMAAAIGIEGAE
jgi:hypothetical protein